MYLVWGLLACGDPEAQEQAEPAANVESRSIERIVVATGTIEPEGEVHVRPRIAGIIEAILVTEGQEVEVGDVLIEIERELLSAQVAEAQAGVETARVEVRYAKITQGRAHQLKLEGASSDSKRDEANAAYETAIARLRRAQAGFETLSVQLRHATVRAPIAGRILNIPIEEGTAVSPVTAVTGGTHLLSMAATNRLHLEGSVDENEIAHVAIGQPARIRTEAFEGRTFEGTVRDISPVGNRIQNVTYFEVEIEITDAESALLRPRMSGDAEIVTETIQDALVIPETALRYAGEDIYVSVLPKEDSEGELERRDVEVGIVDRDSVQILRGLEIGERVSLQ